MDEIYYRMDSVDGVGVNAEIGDVIIAGPVGPNTRLLTAIPLDDLPLLVTYLSRAYAQASSGLPQNELGTSLNAEAPQFVDHPDQSKVTLHLELFSGVSLAFGLPKDQCAALRDQLDRLLG
ncbi:MAG: hypothetical protein ACK4K7_14355 [Allosphingosinicella sp.]|uniref:hypothetical protein n=1 Tax=Allosphingosinicella sp. TaxID=2823234 RepID=UPI0039278A76